MYKLAMLILAIGIIYVLMAFVSAYSLRKKRLNVGKSNASSQKLNH